MLEPLASCLGRSEKRIREKLPREDFEVREKRCREESSEEQLENHCEELCENPYENCVKTIAKNIVKTHTKM